MNKETRIDTNAMLETKSQTPVIECRDLQMSFDDAGDALNVLQGIEFRVFPGDFISIVGNSGCGKSTLLHLLAGLESPSQGEVYVAGQLVNSLTKAQRATMRRQSLGFVYQLHHLLPEFSASENVAMPLMLRGETKAKSLEQANHWLERVGLSQRIKHRPSALSGGERQRVAIARALAGNPKCVLADEPTGNLDEHSAAQVQDLLFSLAETGTSFIVVTHDNRFAGRAMLRYKMSDGLLSELD